MTLSSNYNYSYSLKSKYMNNSTLVMVAVLADIAMMAAAVIVLVPIQQASALDTNFTFKQRQYKGCSGAAECTNSGTTTFSPFT